MTARFPDGASGDSAFDGAEDLDSLARAEEAELARRAAGSQASRADQGREPPETYPAPQAPARGLAPGEGAMGEGFPHDLGGPRGDHSPGRK